MLTKSQRLVETFFVVYLMVTPLLRCSDFVGVPEYFYRHRLARTVDSAQILLTATGGVRNQRAEQGLSYGGLPVVDRGEQAYYFIDQINEGAFSPFVFMDVPVYFNMRMQIFLRFSTCFAYVRISKS